MPGARIGVSGSEQGGSVCELAGTGQGQEVLGGGWEGARAVWAPQLGRERCQHIPGAAGQRVCVWAQGKCMAIADLPHCPPRWSHIAPGQPRPHGVMAQPPAATPRQEPHESCCQPGIAPRQGALSWELLDAKGPCPCTDNPSGPSPPGILRGRPRCAVLSLPHTGCSPWPALLQPRKAAGDWDRKDERMGKEEDGREPIQPIHPGPGDASLLTETRSVGPQVAAGECVGTQGRKETAGILLILSFPGILLLPWLGSALCYNQARVLHREGPECGGSTPGGCALTMSPWLAVPEVPTAEGAAPMAPLPLSLSLL